MQIELESVRFIQLLIKKKGCVVIPAKGYSMYPFIKNGDLCEFTECEPEDLKKGDVVLFCTSNQQLVAHRFIKKEKGSLYFCKGDSNLQFDAPIQVEDILGRMAVIERKNKKIILRNVRASIWSQLIISLPVISRILNSYVRRKGDFQY